MRDEVPYIYNQWGELYQKSDFSAPPGTKYYCTSPFSGYCPLTSNMYLSVNETQILCNLSLLLILFLSIAVT
jgi:hypothetical protein